MKKFLISLLMAVSLMVASGAPRKDVIAFDNSVCPHNTVAIPAGSFYLQVQLADGTWSTLGGRISGLRDGYVRVYCVDGDVRQYRLVRAWALKNGLVK